MTLDVVETLRDLVRIPSVNPMGRDVSGPEYFEYAVTDYLQHLFDELGLPWQRQQVAPKRNNIFARLDGSTPPEEGGKILMLEAHQDTVPIEGMTIEPFDPEIRDGRLYGRGSCDIKGGMASMLAALSRLAIDRPPHMPTIVMACTVNEEYGFSGATYLTRLFSEGNNKLIPRAPDAIIVAEPTLLDVVVAHKGVIRWHCHTAGCAAHSSQPELGDNAIYRMARTVGAFETYASDVAPTLGQHPLVGYPTLSVGLIEGGISVNTVPDQCTIEIDRRLLPGEDPMNAFQDATQYIDAHCGLDRPPNHDPPYVTAHGLNDDNNGAIGRRLCEIAKEHEGSGEAIGVSFGTDAAAFGPAGVPTVIFGPGSIDQAHTIDEWIEIDQLHKAAEIIYHLAAAGDWCESH